MKQVACAQCGTSRPMGEMFTVFGRTLCEACGNAELAQRQAGKEKVPEDAVARQVDPTVCAKCGQDYGSAALPLVGSIPLCDRCARGVLRYPFPTWLKAALAAVVLLALLSFARNWRFVQGYLEFQRGLRLAKAGDLERAAALLDDAARRVPESRDIEALASFFRAAVLLHEDKSAEALPLLQKCQARMPKNAEVRELLLAAEMGAAFDRKDYDTFLAKSQARAAQKPNDPVAVAGVASAVACKYAVTGDEALKREALQLLEKAAALASRDKGEEKDFKDYEARIRYRLETREVITRKEYERRFPQGWKKEEAPK